FPIPSSHSSPPTSASPLSPIPSPHRPSRFQAPSLLSPINQQSPHTPPTSTASHSTATARHAKMSRVHYLEPRHVHQTEANPPCTLVSSSHHIAQPSAAARRHPSTLIHVIFSAAN